MIMQRFVKLMISAVGVILLSQAVMAQDRAANAIVTSPPALEPDDIEFEIKKLEIDKDKYDDNFPKIRGIGGSPSQEWMLIRLEYEWKVDKKAIDKKRAKPQEQGDNKYWLDELEFDWRVVLAQPSSGARVKETNGRFNIDPKYALRMNKQVKYVNVCGDEEHTAVMFIDGRVLTRYIKRLSPSIVFIDLRIKVNGREIGRMNSHGTEIAFGTATENDRDFRKEEKAREALVPRESKRGASFFVSEEVKKLSYGLLNRQETPWQWNKGTLLQTIVKPEE